MVLTEEKDGNGQNPLSKKRPKSTKNCLLRLRKWAGSPSSPLNKPGNHPEGVAARCLVFGT